MTKEFLVLIGLSSVIAIPLVFWAVMQWLSTFAYRMSWNVWLFLFSLILVSAVTLVTMCFNIIKVALINPVETIKHE